MKKGAKIAKNYQTLKKFSSDFIKIHTSGAANCHAPVQYANYVFFFFFFLFFFCFFFFFFFLSSHYDTNPLLYLYHFRKKYNYILANINSESSRVIFSFFLSSSSGSNIFVPQRIL